MGFSIINKPSYRYTIDLQAYMAECEANYLRLMKLMPDNEDEFSYKVALPNNQQVMIQFLVHQRCKYTTMMTIDQEGSADWLPNNHFEIRVYHDASMVEVMAYQKHRCIQPKYAYPNEKMYQKDEKYQQHRFLSECLANCLGNGLCIVEHQIA